MIKGPQDKKKKNQWHRALTMSYWRTLQQNTEKHREVCFRQSCHGWKHNTLQRQQMLPWWWWLCVTCSSRTFSPCRRGKLGLSCVFHRATAGHPADWGRIRESPPSHSLGWSQTTTKKRSSPTLTLSLHPNSKKNDTVKRKAAFTPGNKTSFLCDWTGTWERRSYYT